MTPDTLAIAGPSAVAGSRAAVFVRYLDLLALALALPVFIAAGFPMLAYYTIAVIWLAQLAVEVYAERRSRAELAAGNRRGAMGWIGATALGRVWMVTTTVLLLGLLATREDGLAAALLAVVLFTLHFACRFVARLLEDPAEERLR